MENNIEWTVTNEVLESDVDEREINYLAHGEDKSGKKYTGSAKFVCDTFEGILDVEEV